MCALSQHCPQQWLHHPQLLMTAFPRPVSMNLTLFGFHVEYHAVLPCLCLTYFTLLIVKGRDTNPSLPRKVSNKIRPDRSMGEGRVSLGLKVWGDDIHKRGDPSTKGVLQAE